MRKIFALTLLLTATAIAAIGGVTITDEVADFTEIWIRDYPVGILSWMHRCYI